MAEFNSYLLGKAKRSVGNITLCYTRRKNIAKAKVFSRKDNPTSEILDQRARMKVLVELSRYILPVIRKGFVGIGNGTTSNAFVKVNMKSVNVDEKHVAKVDLDILKMASGLLYPPKVTVSYTEENQLYSFEQEMQDEEDGFAMTNDKVYAVIYESVLSRAKLIGLRDRGENGNTSYGLQEDWDSKNVKVYCFATSSNGKLVSDSRVLTLA